ncbi:MAG: carboxylating nicotinate-nucleotide diphosphorylase [Gammaproteobacteria bacterium]|nr:carboxylating nicotinate-nucleotide diphosphorylase [Gammaproteobacteria bacterium]MDD9816196.1 carboxylating nicotinate-nucleotide diphosphorylase [Gammaproteobacteria bacterium]
MSLPAANQIEQAVQDALREDLGGALDLGADLSAAAVPADKKSAAQLLCRAGTVLCGAAWFEAAIRQLDSSARFAWSAAEGDDVNSGQQLCRVEAQSRALLAAERTALNFLQLLSATAHAARRAAALARGTPCRVLDTRKTIPGLRAAQKYAVRTGGAQNHRAGLFDAVLLKENHIRAAGGIARAVRAARKHAPAGAALTVEVENVEQLEQAIRAGATRILLDNFTAAALAEAVRRNRGRAELEASGGISGENLRAAARSGVDCVSLGALTKNICAADYSLLFEKESAG